MTTILAIDAATGPCSAAVWKDGRVAAYAETLRPESQSAALMPMVEEVLKKSKTAYGDLTLVAATVGPGSFTGIRVGLAAARGIAFAAGLKTAGFTTLDVLAFAAKQKALAILNAGKGEVYYQLPGGEPLLGTLEQAIAAASGVPAVGNMKESNITFPRADALAELAATRCESLPLTPFYIRDPDAKLPKRAES